MPGRYRSDTLEQRISIERLEQAVNIFGSFDENIRLLEQEFSVTAVSYTHLTLPTTVIV